jgi:hypothetical protein
MSFDGTGGRILPGVPIAIKEIEATEAIEAGAVFEIKQAKRLDSAQPRQHLASLHPDAAP